MNEAELPLRHQDLKDLGEHYQQLAELLGGPEVSPSITGLSRDMLNGQMVVKPNGAAKPLSPLEVLILLRDSEFRARKRSLSRDNVHTAAALGGAALLKIYEEKPEGLSDVALSGITTVVRRIHDRMAWAINGAVQPENANKILGTMHDANRLLHRKVDTDTILVRDYTT